MKDTQITKISHTKDTQITKYTHKKYLFLLHSIFLYLHLLCKPKNQAYGKERNRTI